MIATVMMLAAIHTGVGLRSESPGEFFYCPGNIDVSNVGVIPGDDNFYADVMAEIGQTWSVTTNGLWTPLTREIIGPVFDQTEPLYRLSFAIDGVLEKLAIDDITFPTNTIDWRPNVFDFSFHANESNVVRLTSNGDGERVQMGRLSGPYNQCYQPRAFRIDDATYATVLATYDAYFERLYYASEGDDTDDWDDSWGYASPSSLFMFNVNTPGYFADCYFDFDSATNGLREVENTRRLVERKRLKLLRDNLRDELFMAEVVIGGHVKPVSPDFIYRPGWLLDPERNPDKVNPSRVWWSSTAPPPAYDFGAAIQIPSTKGFSFFPLFDWTDMPISIIDPASGERVPRTDWADYCVTFNMARTIQPTHPLAELFRHLGYDGPDLDEYVRPYEFAVGNGIYAWMTNTYPACVMQFIDKRAAMRDYADSCWGASGDPVPARLRPNDYTGVNQLLAAMDRTIHIPSMKVFSSNELVTVRRSAEYESGDLAARITFDPDSFSLTVTVEDERLSLWQHGSGDDEKRTEAVREEIDGLRIEAEKPSFQLDADSPTVIIQSKAYIDEGFLASNGSEGLNSLFIDQVVPARGDPFDVFQVAFRRDEMGETEYDYILGLPPRVERESSFMMKAVLKRSYSYELPTCSGVRLGVTQPGSYNPPMNQPSCLCGILSRIDYYTTGDYGHIETGELYRASGELGYSSRSDIESLVDDNTGTMQDKIFEIIDKSNGEKGLDPRVEDMWAPMPTPLEATFSCTSGTVNQVDIGVTFDELYTKTFTNGCYYYWTELSTNVVEEQWETITITDHVTNFLQKIETTRYYGSGREDSVITLTTNVVVENIRNSTNLLDRTEDRSYYHYRSGPYAEPQTKLTVPFEVVVTNKSIEIYSNTSFFLITYADYVTICEYSGTGPDDPGEKINEWSDSGGLISEEYDFESVSTTTNCPGTPVEHWHETDYILDETQPGVETAYPEFTRIDFTLDDGEVGGIKVVRRYWNPFTMEYVFDEQGAFPIEIGNVSISCGLDTSVSTPEDPGGASRGLKSTANMKVITQTDWKWKFLKRTDKHND